MTCYDETRDKDSEYPYHPRRQRDGNNVREIAEDPAAFCGHTRPRRYVEGSEDQQESKE